MLSSRFTLHACVNIILLLFCLINSLFAQSYTRDYAPKTPEASAFTKYDEYSVGQFTGRANISIPLPISEEVPISLSYNAGGNKPEEHHGWVGQGWNLNNLRV